MAITPGSRIGPYEVTAQLGEGGMGVVFRGRDSRLQRDVALKLLPDNFVGDPDRLSRFQREAQTLASLNHANIAQIYGLEQVEGSTCIVMELVEGETLEERLKKGPFSFEEAIDVARQIAEALAVAHERGIVHRDLKPANIKITPSGAVKVLDFGLAKALGPKTSDTSLTAMPTVATGSIVGAIVGTPGYMSPEQARGKEVDARTDIWAFGCVLYEMLTAHPAFGGETITDIMAKIVASPPDLDLLPKNTPPSIRLLLSSTLNKNSAQRLQHIGDTRLFMDGTLAATAPSSAMEPVRRGIGSKALTAVFAVVLVALAIPAALYFRGSRQTAPQMYFEIALAEIVGQPLVSPDGGMIAWATQPASGKRTLWIRPIGSMTGRQIPGTENVSGVIWAPDGKRMAIHADGKLKVIDLADGSSRQLAEIGALRGGAWNNNGDILLARTSDNILVHLSESGGPITQVTTLNAERKEAIHALPTFLNDGKRFVFVAAGGSPEGTGIFLASLGSKDPPELILPLQVNRFNGMNYLASGHLVYNNENKIIAHHIGATGRVEGQPILVAENVEGGFSASLDGMIIYRKATPSAGRQLLWYTREGKMVGQVGQVVNYGNLDLSPKGDRAAVDIRGTGGRDIWVVDIERSIAQPITFDEGDDWTVSWSPDGSRLAFASSRVGNQGVTKIYEKSSTGTGTETIVPSGDVSSIPVHWSPDGKYIVFSRLRQAGNTASYDTWLLPLFGERKPAPLLETGFDKFQARVSPGSDYIAYSTNESGMYQIVVQTFPDPSRGRWQISAEGGVEPKWRRDGRELYYLALDGKLISVSIGGGASLNAGRPVELFQTPLTVNRAQPARDRRYDVATDGRFLMVVPAATGPALPHSVIVNWRPATEK